MHKLELWNKAKFLKMNLKWNILFSKKRKLFLVLHKHEGEDSIYKSSEEESSSEEEGPNKSEEGSSSSYHSYKGSSSYIRPSMKSKMKNIKELDEVQEEQNEEPNNPAANDHQVDQIREEKPQKDPQARDIPLQEPCQQDEDYSPESSKLNCLQDQSSDKKTVELNFGSKTPDFDHIPGDNSP